MEAEEHAPVAAVYDRRSHQAGKRCACPATAQDDWITKMKRAGNIESGKYEPSLLLSCLLIQLLR